MKVEQFSTAGESIKVWRNATEAAESLGLDASHIIKVCMGKRNTHGNYMWAYVQEEDESFSGDGLDTDKTASSSYSSLKRAEDFVLDPLFQEFLQFRRGKIDKMQYTPGIHFVYGCVHMPFHNKAFFDATLDLAMDLKPHLVGLHLIGDFVDLNSLSGHEKGKVPIKGVTLDSEYAGTNRELNRMDDVFSGVKEKNYLFGNHEDRYLRHVKDVNNSKYGDALISPVQGLRLLERGYRVQSDWKNGRIYLGRFLELCHGEFLNIHSAKKHIDVYRTSIMYAHTHRVQQYIEGNCGGFNIGWMGDVTDPAFSYASRGQREKWNNGFALVQIDKDGYYFVHQIIWQNNSFYYNGKKYG